ncbi:MAG: acyl-CoA dehydrogenase family protein [Defluviicoccus sp.]|nr:acyl-CoA dehydrogenase family protein [Defluviicoccus sp.]
MFRDDSADEAAFRAEVRGWLEANLPEALRGRTDRPPPDEIMPWYRALAARGWIAPHWPRERGGMGASLAQQIVLTQELARLSAPQLPVQGINHIGPILMRYGTDAQQARHLPPILSGDVIWAQGYSEPGAGSDLASLSTRAVLKDGRFVVDGGKIWQTWAHHADWMFTLVRTDPAAKVRQAGISFILIDLASPGIEIRPIRAITGEEEFSQVFLDGVEVPGENLVGALHGGWNVATALLATERLFTSNPQYALEAMERIKAVAAHTGIDRDAAFRDRLAGLSISITVQAAMFWQAVDMAASGIELGPEGSTMKLVATGNLQRATDLLIEAAGPWGADAGPIETAAGPVDATGIFLQSRRATIYGGSSEIQRNVLAKRVLGLPGG